MKKFLLWVLIAIAAIVLTTYAAQAGTKTITFQWDSNTEADLVGYKLYKANTAGGPYEFVVSIPHSPGLPTQTSPSDIVVPDGTETTIYFVLTAYDNAGNESGYSNEVSATIDYKKPGSPVNFIIKVVNQ